MIVPLNQRLEKTAKYPIHRRLPSKVSLLDFRIFTRCQPMLLTLSLSILLTIKKPILTAIQEQSFRLGKLQVVYKLFSSEPAHSENPRTTLACFFTLRPHYKFPEDDEEEEGYTFSARDFLPTSSLNSLRLAYAWHNEQEQPDAL